MRMKKITMIRPTASVLTLLLLLLVILFKLVDDYFVVVYLSMLSLFFGSFAGADAAVARNRCRLVVSPSRGWYKNRLLCYPKRIGLSHGGQEITHSRKNHNLASDAGRR